MRKERSCVGVQGSVGGNPGKPAKVCGCGLPAQQSRGSAGENITPLHRRGSNQRQGGGGHAKMLGQQSHNPLVCVSDEGAFGSVLFQGGVSLVLIKTDQINQRNQIGSSFLLRLGGSVFDLFFFLQVKADIVL